MKTAPPSVGGAQYFFLYFKSNKFYIFFISFSYSSIENSISLRIFFIKPHHKSLTPHEEVCMLQNPSHCSFMASVVMYGKKILYYSGIVTKERFISLHTFLNRISFEIKYFEFVIIAVLIIIESGVFIL